MLTLIISRDVEFLKNKEWVWDNNTIQQHSLDLKHIFESNQN